MKLLHSLTIGAALFAAPAAFAQDAPASPAPAAAATAVSDAEVDQYVAAALAANKVHTDASVAEADKPAKMSAAVTATGLTAERFNAISQAMQADPALNQRIQTAAAAKVGTAPAAP